MILSERTREAMRLRAAGKTYREVGRAILGHDYMLKRGQPMEPITPTRAQQLVVLGWEKVLRARRRASREWFRARGLPLFPIGARACLKSGGHCPTVEQEYFRRLAMRYAAKQAMR